MKQTHSKLWILLGILLSALLCCEFAFAQDNGRVRLGVSVTPLQASPILLQHLRLSEGEGLMVSNVAVGGELEAAGLSQGDILLAIDGHPLSQPSDLTDYVAKLPAKANVTLDVIQKGEHRQIYLALDNLPDDVSWKYVVPGTNRSRTPRLLPNQGTMPKSAVPAQPLQPQAGAGLAQQMTFSSIISTDEGIKRSTVKISGPSDNPDTQIEITLDSDTFTTTIGELDKLPEDARTAAESAIAQSRNFSFSFGGSMFGNPFGAQGGNDWMEEMMRRHQEQMQMMDEMFQRQFGPMPQQQLGPAQIPQVPQSQPRSTKPPVLQPLPDDAQQPLKPSKNDIRS